MGRMREWAATLAMTAVAVGLVSPAVGATSNVSLAGGGQWPMFMGGFTHTGVSDALGPKSATVSWTIPSTGTIGNYSDRGMAPVVGSDGIIYLLQAKGNYDARLEAISPITHKVLWSWTGKGNPTFSVPAVAPDGTVYVVMDNDEKQGIDAIESGGTKLWKDPNSTFSTYLNSSPTIGPDGTVYVEDENSVVYALNPQNGDIYWSFAGSVGTDGEQATPAISADGTTLYLPSGGGDLYALSAGPTGGQLEWTYQVQGPPGGSIANAPAVGPDGTIYLATEGEDGNTPADIEAVNPNGTLKWAYVSNGTFQSTPTVTTAGQVVAGNDVGTVVALDQSDGAVVWSHATSSLNAFGDASPASDGNGNVYIQNSQHVLAYAPDGSLLWKATDSTFWSSSPALAHSGTLYVTGSRWPNQQSDPTLIAFKSTG